MAALLLPPQHPAVLPCSEMGPHTMDVVRDWQGKVHRVCLLQAALHVCSVPCDAGLRSGHGWWGCAGLEPVGSLLTGRGQPVGAVTSPGSLGGR